MERMVCPPGLSGRRGANRLPAELLLIEADNDFDAILAWLSVHAHVPSTWRVYRNVAEQLLNWAWFSRCIAVSSMTEADFRAFFDFIRSPQPEEMWIAGRRAGRADFDWKPFRKPPGRTGARRSASILGALASWMSDVGYANLALRVGQRNLAEWGLASDLSILGGAPLKPRQSIDMADWHWIVESIYAPETPLVDRLMVHLVYFACLFSSEIEQIRSCDVAVPDASCDAWRLTIQHRPNDRKLIYVLPPLADSLGAWVKLIANQQDSNTKGTKLIGSSREDICVRIRKCISRAADMALRSGDTSAAARLKSTSIVALRSSILAHCSRHESSFWILLAAHEQASLYFLRNYVSERVEVLSTNEVHYLFEGLSRLWRKLRPTDTEEADQPRPAVTSTEPFEFSLMSGKQALH